MAVYPFWLRWTRRRPLRRRPTGHSYDLDRDIPESVRTELRALPEETVASAWNLARAGHSADFLCETLAIERRDADIVVWHAGQPGPAGLNHAPTQRGLAVPVQAGADPWMAAWKGPSAALEVSSGCCSGP